MLETSELKARATKLKNYLYNEGYFSEYLPSEFCLGGINDTYEKKAIGTIMPYRYTMSKFRGDNQRRVIQIPELVSYLAAVESFDKSVLERIVTIDADSKSFSKLFSSQDNEVVRYSNPSDAPLNTLQEGATVFSSNIIRKLITGKGAKGILYLDIANFFDSFYTHNITAIFSGEKWAHEQYKSCQVNKTKMNAEYEVLKKSR
jgi:hypothetical protein